MNRLIPLIIAWACSSWVFGQHQLTARVDSLEMLIGDQQNLVIQFKSTESVAPDFKTEALDSAQFLEIIQQTPWQRIQEGTGTKIEKNIRFAIFDTGRFVIPAVYAMVGPDSLTSHPIPLIVYGIEPDSTGLRPIKGIIREKSNWRDYIWLYIIILGIAIAYGIYRYIQKRKALRPSQIIVPVEILKPPHQIALEKLALLKESRLWEQGEIKEYHSQLTYILREYLEQRYQIPALESTSYEIIKRVQNQLEAADWVQTVYELLNIADWVKFAKGIPEAEANEKALDRAIEFVLATKPEANPSTSTTM
jgi:hypothetical protein